MAKESSNELAELIAGKARKVILWQDPVFSGVTFAIGLAGFLFMGVGYPSVTVVAYGLLYAAALSCQSSHALYTLVRFAYRHGTTMLGELNVIEKRTQPRTPETFVTVEDVQASLPAIVDGLNRALHAAGSLVLADDAGLALKWMAGLYALALTSRMLGSTGLFFLVFVCAFTLPKGYEKKKTEVDAAMARGFVMVEDLSSATMDKLKEWRKMPLKPKHAKPAGAGEPTKVD